MTYIARLILELACLRALVRQARLYPETLTTRERARLRRECDVMIPRCEAGESLDEDLEERLLSAEVLLLISEVLQGRPQDTTAELGREIKTMNNRLERDEDLRAFVRDDNILRAKRLIKKSYKQSYLNGYNKKRVKLVVTEDAKLGQRAERAPVDAWNQAKHALTPQEELIAQESAWYLPSDPERLLEVMSSDEALRARGGTLLLLLSLSISQRQCWGLRYISEWRAAQVATRLNMTERAVHMSAYHARQGIQAKLIA